MTNNEVALRTRRKKARYGTKVEIAGQPLMVVKSGNNEDSKTAAEIDHDLYGKPVDHIVFKEVVSF